MMVRGLFEDAVQFFTAKDAGRHGLGLKLQHSRVDTGGRCSGNRELFVDPSSEKAISSSLLEKASPAIMPILATASAVVE